MKMPDGLLGKSGVYQIINIMTGKIYVGSSVDLYRRYYIHYGSLNKNRHENPKLQRSWNKYGEDAFDFYVIEFLPKDKELIRKREQFWVDKLDPFYNIIRDVGKPLSQPRSLEHRQHHSASMKTSPKVQSREYKNSQSEKMKAVWATDEYRKGREEYYSTEDAKKKMSEQGKEAWRKTGGRLIQSRREYILEHAYSNRRSKAKISADLVRSVRSLYSSGDYTLGELAEKFSIALSTTSRIVNRKSWAWIE